MKRQVVLFVVFVCFVGVVRSNEIDWDKLDINDLCKSLEDPSKSWNIVKCAKDQEYHTRLGTNYIKDNGVPKDLDPIILVPGVGGSGIRAKLDKNSTPAWYCFKRWDWFRIWLALQELVVQDCWMDNLQVIFAQEHDDWHNQYGVDTHSIDFGGLGGIDYLDYWFGLPIPFTSYFHTMIESLKKVGYVPGVNLFGAPYDWRMPTTDKELHHQQFPEHLIPLVEKAVNITNRKVHFVAHSMGGPTILAFLNQMDPEWVERNVNTFIPIAAPFAGAPKILRALISGDDFGIAVLGQSLVSLKKARDLARTAGGIIYLVPDRHYNKDTIVEAHIDGEKREYNADDFGKLFLDMGAPKTRDIYERVKDIMHDMKVPNITSHCIFGYGLATEYKYNYTQGFGAQPIIFTDDLGDGTVPLESLEECEMWADHQSPPVDVKKFDLRDHFGILEDQEVFDYIISITTKR